MGSSSPKMDQNILGDRGEKEPCPKTKVHRKKSVLENLNHPSSWASQYHGNGWEEKYGGSS